MKDLVEALRYVLQDFMTNRSIVQMETFIVIKQQLVIKGGDSILKYVKKNTAVIIWHHFKWFNFVFLLTCNFTNGIVLCNLFNCRLSH